MRLARRVAAGLLLGAFIGFLAALLRPRSVHGGAPARRDDHAQAGPAARQPEPGEAGSPRLEGPSPSREIDLPSRIVIDDEATRPLSLPAPAPQPVTGGTA